ncbi:hypothetical protein [Streptomyces shenzhenensis]|uniref:hypothetical protein n=1 Tax=Streptomyces shenzhenensis TaxID=943815 RepID=UPI0036ABE432
MPDLKHARRPIRDLVSHLEYRATFGRPVYVKRNQQYAALIVPELRNGAEGPYGYLKTYQRATVDEAVVLGYVVLGDQLVDVPGFSVAGRHWCTERAHQGRTIALPGGGA